MKKIGMCQACGDQGETIIHDNGEYCMHCAGMLGLDKDDDQEEEDDMYDMAWPWRG